VIFTQIFVSTVITITLRISYVYTHLLRIFLCKIPTQLFFAKAASQIIVMSYHKGALLGNTGLIREQRYGLTLLTAGRNADAGLFFVRHSGIDPHKNGLLVAPM
jgi:hypothetical protein